MSNFQIVMVSAGALTLAVYLTGRLDLPKLLSRLKSFEKPAEEETAPAAVPDDMEAFKSVRLLLDYFETNDCEKGLNAARLCGESLFAKTSKSVGVKQ